MCPSTQSGPLPGLGAHMRDPRRRRSSGTGVFIPASIMEFDEAHAAAGGPACYPAGHQAPWTPRLGQPCWGSPPSSPSSSWASGRAAAARNGGRRAVSLDLPSVPYGIARSGSGGSSSSSASARSDSFTFSSPSCGSGYACAPSLAQQQLLLQQQAMAACDYAAAGGDVDGHLQAMMAELLQLSELAAAAGRLAPPRMDAAAAQAAFSRLPPVSSDGLSSYATLHRAQRLKHERCLSVATAAAFYGPDGVVSAEGLSEEAQAKLQELMIAQQLQLQIQTELLQLLGME
ncbi:hypothetical protein HT031_002171 [Scenedesmus sp. PABB004]|nr:hypothetical protein HT031_002171 [Scenedesmus sp. PABB004]